MFCCYLSAINIQFHPPPLQEALAVKDEQIADLEAKLAEKSPEDQEDNTNLEADTADSVPVREEIDEDVHSAEEDNGGCLWFCFLSQEKKIYLIT